MDEWLSEFEINWHNKNVRQLNALVIGYKYILENDSQKIKGEKLI